MSEATYHEPEYKAGYTDEELEEHGDAVLMNWRNWVNLREVILEHAKEVQRGEGPSWLAGREGAYVSGLDWVMAKMDETPPW